MIENVDSRPKKISTTTRTDERSSSASWSSVESISVESTSIDTDDSVGVNAETICDKCGSINSKIGSNALGLTWCVVGVMGVMIVMGVVGVMGW